MLTKDVAICIRARDYSETSQIVTFFARKSGKISTIAKGSKRAKSAFDGPIEMFAYGDIVYSDSSKAKLATLTEFEQQRNFRALTSNLFALNCANFAAELINSMTDEHDPHPELFDSLVEFLQNVSENHQKPKSLIFLILFQLSLLKEAGLQPILNVCLNCKSDFNSNWPEIYFSSLANGLICRDCQANFPERIRISKQAANVLSNLKLLAESNEKTLNEIEKVLIHHFTETLGKSPKMAKYILKS